MTKEQLKKMKKAELIKVIVPAKIASWKVGSPEFIHDGKETKLIKAMWTMRKEYLINEYIHLKKRGFIK